MAKALHYLLWLFVFSVPWEFVPLPGVGGVSRLFGLLAIVAGALATFLKGRLRRPPVILWAALAFTAWSFLTLLWSVDYSASVDRVFTYVQLLASLWLVTELASTREQQQSLMFAFCLGAFVPIVGQLRNYAAGIEVAEGGRYAVSGLNADSLGLGLVLGFPFAWYLFVNRRGVVRIVAAIYCPLALIGMMLSGTRAAFLAAIVAVAIVPLTVRIGSLRSVVLTATLTVVALVSIIWFVPSSSWERMLTIREELSGGTMTGRTDIWKAGLNAFQERPLVGFGAGAFGAAVASSIPEERKRFAHNVLLSVLVEQGFIGLFLYSLLLAACAWTLTRLEPPERTLWFVVMLTWFVGVMSLSWEYHKVTWLLLGLLGAQRIGESARHRVPAAPRLPAGVTPPELVDGSQARGVGLGRLQLMPRRPSPTLRSR